MIDAILLALCFTGYDTASVDLSLAGLAADAARFDGKEVAVGDVLAERLNRNTFAVITAMQDGYRAVAAMSRAELAAPFDRCDTGLASVLR